MNDITFLGKCVDSDHCLNFTCPWFTPEPYTHRTLPPAEPCEKTGKLVFVMPLHDEMTITELLEKEGIVEGK